MNAAAWGVSGAVTAAAAVSGVVKGDGAGCSAATGAMSPSWVAANGILTPPLSTASCSPVETPPPAAAKATTVGVRGAPADVPVGVPDSGVDVGVRPGAKAWREVDVNGEFGTIVGLELELELELKTELELELALAMEVEVVEVVEVEVELEVVGVELGLELEVESCGDPVTIDPDGGVDVRAAVMLPVVRKVVTQQATGREYCAALGPARL